MIESSTLVISFGPFFSKSIAKQDPNLSQELNDAISAFYSDAVPTFPNPETHPNEVYYYQGLHQLENGLFEKALQSLQLSKLESEQRILLISWIQLQTNPDEAIKTLEQSKEKVFSSYIIGLAHLKKGDKQEAQKFLKQSADEKDPHNFYAQVELKRQAKQYADAVKLFEELLKKDSTNLRLKYGLAELLLEKELNSRQIQWGDLEIKPNVRKSFDILTEIARDNLRYKFLLAQVNYYLDLPTEFDSFIAQNFQVDQAYYFKGLIEKEVLNYSKAQECFQKAYQSMKSDIYYIQSAQMYIELKQAEKALKELDNVANGCHQYVTLGQAYLLKGDRDQASKWFEEALKVEPNLYAQIYKFSLLDRVDEVQKLIDQGIKAEPNNYVLLWQKGKFLNRLQRFQDSLQQFDKAITFKYVPAYASKAKALRSLNKSQDAINLTDEGLKLKQYPPLFTVKASALIDLKKYDEAIKACDELLTIQQDNVHALKFKALALKLNGQIQESGELYDKITSLDPSNLQAHIGKAVAAKESGDLKTYKEQITKIQDSVVKAKNPIVQVHTNDLIKLKKNFESKGDAIESVSAKDSVQYLEFQKLKQQKEQVEAQKLQIITQPNLKSTVPDDVTQQILDKLELLNSQVQKLQKENERLRYQNLIQDTKISAITKEQQLIWENLKSSGAYEKANIQLWFESCKETEKYNYAIAFYWTLLNHFNSYTMANVGALSQNKGFTEDGQQRSMVGYANEVLVYASNKLTTSIPVLGNIYSLIDDVIDYCYSQVRDKRYADRIRSIIKIINENGTSTIAENLSLVIAKSAQTIADQTDFTIEDEKKQLNFIEETIDDVKQIYDGKVNELREAVFGKNITIYQNLGGKKAIKDVISVIAYLQENYAIIIANSKSTPLDQQISEIVLEQRSNELLKKSHSQPSKQPLSKFDPLKSSVNFEDIIRRDEEGRATSGCCIIQ